MRLRLLRNGLVAAILIFGSCRFLSAAVIRVPFDQPTIQQGIDAAVPFDTVLVDDGVYTGFGNRDMSFGGKALVLLSVNGPASTIIDCEATIDDPHRGFVFENGEDSASILSGFTIKRGVAWFPITNGGDGGAILCVGTSPMISDCVFEYNIAAFGGAIAMKNLSAATLVDCLFLRNTSVQIGGAIYFLNSNVVTMLRCRFLYNNGGHVAGCIYSSNSQLTMEDCDFLYNIGPIGAAVGAASNSKLIATRCIFFGNAVNTDVAVFSLGTTDAVFTNCTFSNNRVFNPFKSDGAVISLFRSTLSLDRCIISYNVNGGGGPAIKLTETVLEDTISTVTMVCTDIFGNNGSDWTGLLASQANINDNFSLSPQYCDTTSGDLSLQDDSPCASNNSPCGQLVGAREVECIITDVDYDTSTLLPEKFVLHQNYPNPFNPTTIIPFSLPERSHVQITIYNALGQRVRVLLDEIRSPGEHQIVWNARNESGKQVSSGVYFVVMTTDTKVESKKMILLR